MSRYGNEIVQVALEWYQRGCVETSPNRGVCIDAIHAAFDPDWIRSKRSEAWCAKFVWVCYQQAADALGIQNPMPHTASARGLMDQARSNGIPVNGKPAVGAAFYRYSGSAGSSGHNGIVRALTSDGIETVEGNLSDKVSLYRYSWSAVNDPKRGFQFIHGEQYGPQVQFAGTSLAQMAVLGAVGLGAWYMWRKR